MMSCNSIFNKKIDLPGRVNFSTPLDSANPCCSSPPVLPNLRAVADGNGRGVSDLDLPG